MSSQQNSNNSNMTTANSKMLVTSTMNFQCQQSLKKHLLKIFVLSNLRMAAVSLQHRRKS